MISLTYNRRNFAILFIMSYASPEEHRLLLTCFKEMDKLCQAREKPLKVPLYRL